MFEQIYYKVTHHISFGDYKSWIYDGSAETG